MTFLGHIRPVSLFNPWPASDGIAAAEVNGTLYKFGGWNTAFPAPYTCNRVDMSVDGGRSWHPLPNAPFSGRHTFPVVVLGGKIYVIGGDANSGVYQPDVWEATPLPWGLRWRLITAASAALLPGRVGHICFSYEGKVVLVGGQTLDEFITNPSHRANRPNPYYDDMWAYSPGDADFVKVRDNLDIAPACFMQGSPVKDGKMWLVGCGAYDTAGRPRVYENRVFSGTLDGFDLVAPDGGFTKCMYNSVAVCGGELVSFGGWNGANLNQLHASPDGAAFRRLTRSAISLRHAATLVNFKNELRLFGGPIAPADTAVWSLS